ncbi:hypothetical protein DOK78_001030 [Enterococcus sp. DIV2402]|uniref:PTS EIIB type-3 domain-containing protein n=1 Tax=Candidatus Enterococcus lowellii TaxID=2230877 RepID=A0ABZ2SQE9_9ENTE|nr:hypothetical protein [Enterococcus sp. DIV2402]MBO0465639.1 hypothetical protein [Enterococcus sp. DIV2402]
MKKVLWIYSINVQDGGPPFGYGHNTSGKGVKRFKEKLKEELPSDIDLQFISYDTTSNVLPSADLIIFNDLDSRYIPEKIKEKGLCIPYQNIYTGNVEDVTHLILNSLTETKN